MYVIKREYGGKVHYWGERPYPHWSPKSKLGNSLPLFTKRFRDQADAEQIALVVGGEVEAVK